MRRSPASLTTTLTPPTTMTWTSPARRCHCRPSRRHTVGPAVGATPRMVGGDKRSTLLERQHHGMAEFIYSMRKVRKAHGDKVILDDVSLNFLPGAKIGVVGPNGAGKSSVLRI